MATFTVGTLPAVGSASTGQALFEHGTPGVKAVQACSSCHSVDGASEVGPTLKGIAATAVSRVSGQTAEEYLFTAIVFPNTYLVPGYSADVMPDDYAQKLSPQQIRDLIAYMRTLK